MSDLTLFLVFGFLWIIRDFARGYSGAYAVSTLQQRATGWTFLQLLAAFTAVLALHT